jgi:hypothetical protein
MASSPLVQDVSTMPMPTNPITPTAPLPAITTPFELLPGAINAHDITSAIFTGAFVIWVFYMVIAIYHWIRYGHNSWLMFPAIAVHVVVSGALLLFAVSGFH